MKVMHSGRGPIWRLAMVAASAAIIGASCSSSTTPTANPSATAATATSTGTAASPTVSAALVDATLHLAFGATMSSPDPAIFYENEGLNVMGALYEGLLQYAPNTVANSTTATPAFQPLLATDYSVSPDGLKYTFHLRSGVKFHDGTPMDAAAVKASFERFKDVNGGPSYMLAQVAQYETPDAGTFIVVLKSPVNPFLDFMASPYGPKVMSPTAIKQKEKNGDLAQEWMKTHDAGTGPYSIASWGTNEYKLAAFADYWGQKAYYKNVDIAIVPSFVTQQLQLQQGSLDLLVNGVLPRDVAALQAHGMQTWVFDNPVLDVIHVNSDKGPFADPAVRTALAQAVDRKSIVKSAFGDAGSLAVTAAPKATLPSGTSTYTPTYDPTALRALVAALPADKRKITIVFATQDTVNQQVANILQAQLAAVGFDATAQGQPLERIFAWQGKPELRSDLLVLQSNGDGANPFTWYSLFYAHGGGLAFMNTSACTNADNLVNQAFATADPAAAAALYVEADTAYGTCGAFIPLADTKGIMAYRPGLSGLVHPFASQTAVLLGQVRPANP